MLTSVHLTPSAVPSSDLLVLKSGPGFAGATVVWRTRTILVGITSEDLLMGQSGPTGTSSKSTIEQSLKLNTFLPVDSDVFYVL